MGINYGQPPIVSKGLAFCVDFLDKNSYPSSGTTVTEMITGGTGTVDGATFGDGVFSFDGTNDTIGKFTTGTGNLYSMGCWFYLNGAFNNSSGAKGLVRMSEPGGTSTSSGTCLGLGSITGLLSGEVITMMTFESSTHGRTGVLNITIGVGWHYAVVNWNGSSYDIHLDGTKQSVSHGSNGQAALTSFDKVSFGRGYQSEVCIDGKMGPLHFYNQQLTDADVLQNFNAQRGRFGV